MDLEWIKNVQAAIVGENEKHGFREEDVYIGNLIQATYYPPTYNKLPKLMEDFEKTLNINGGGIAQMINDIVRCHIQFERIHPFVDGNGRTGRMILNQQLVNNGLLPVAITKKSKYRQAFKLFDRNGDTSLMEHIVLRAQLNAIHQIKTLVEMKNKSYR